MDVILGCLLESLRFLPRGCQILSVTWAYFIIAPQYSSRAFFPFVTKAGFELAFYSILFSLLGTGRIPFA